MTRLEDLVAIAYLLDRDRAATLSCGRDRWWFIRRGWYEWLSCDGKWLLQPLGFSSRETMDDFCNGCRFATPEAALAVWDRMKEASK